jgi:hypothetical protein
MATPVATGDVADGPKSLAEAVTLEHGRHLGNRAPWRQADGQRPHDPAWSAVRSGSARPAARLENQHSLGLPDLPDLPDQFCARWRRARSPPVLPYLLPSPSQEEEEVSLRIDKSGRSGSPREWLVSGRAAGRAVVGRHVGHRASYPATPPADGVSIRRHGAGSCRPPATVRRSVSR